MSLWDPTCDPSTVTVANLLHLLIYILAVSSRDLVFVITDCLCNNVTARRAPILCTVDVKTHPKQRAASSRVSAACIPMHGNAAKTWYGHKHASILHILIHVTSCTHTFSAHIFTYSHTHMYIQRACLFVCLVLI
jgi:hypothetical protein